MSQERFFVFLNPKECNKGNQKQQFSWEGTWKAEDRAEREPCIPIWAFAFVTMFTHYPLKYFLGPTKK